MDKGDSTTKVEVAIERSYDVDPDSGLELQETISAELRASVAEVENGGTTRGLDEVSRRLGLTS